MALNLSARASSTWATPSSIETAILSLPIAARLRLETRVMTRFTVNGQPVHYRMDPETPLLWALRDASNLTGTKFGCGTGHCGACTVHIDGNAVRSCRVPIGRPRRQLRHHHRSAVARPLASGAAGLRRRHRAAMRLLHPRHDHGRRGPDRPQRQRHRRASSTPRSPISAAAASIRASGRRFAAPADQDRAGAGGGRAAFHRLSRGRRPRRSRLARRAAGGGAAIRPGGTDSCRAAYLAVQPPLIDFAAQAVR